MTTIKARIRRGMHILALASVLGLAAASLIGSTEAAGTSYYVDSVSGSDSNSGTSPSSPWQSLGAVSNHSFGAGDTIYLKRGDTWNGTLTINSSGASGSPITVDAYGSGSAPVIQMPNTQGSYSHVVDVYGSYVTVQNLLVSGGNEAGIFIRPNAGNVVIQNDEVKGSGTGIYVEGANARITHNYVHDLTMVVNTQGGNDDYGAEGIFLSNVQNTEVSYNRFVNCRAPSYDYGSDGGVIEFWGNVSGANVHHNYSTGAQGFFEIGGGSSNNITMDYNVSDRDDQDFAMLHLSGSFGSTVSNFKVDNNTIIRSDANYRVLDFGGNSGPSGFYFRNNIVYSNTSIASADGFNHSNNIYYTYGGAGLGSMSLGSGEKQTDPKFVNESGGDYHLQAGSPAIGAGQNLGYTTDFDGKAVANPPSIGAYEYGSSSPTPTATPVLPTPTVAAPTSTPVPTSVASTPVPTSVTSTPVASATPAPVSAPPTSGSVLWTANMETGDLSQWTAGGGGKVSGWGNNSESVSTAYAHSGSHSAALTISGVNSGVSSAAQLVRQAEPHANPNAYYSVWYYIPQSYTPTTYWGIMDYYSVTSSGANPMWTLNLGKRADGSMYLYAFDQTNRVSYGPSNGASIPVGKWFNVEVYYQQATGNGGRVTVYQDGQQIMDMNGVTTRQSGDQIDWVVTDESDNISPSTATLYVDDAAIGTGYMAPSSATAPTATPVTVTPTPTVVTPTATPALPTPTAVAPTSTPDPVSAPTSGSVLWTANMESGNLSQWTKTGGWGSYSTGVSTAEAHSGTHSAQLGITTDSSGNDDTAQLVRSPEPHAYPDAYYSVWYYIPQSYTPSQYWGIMNFYSVLNGTGTSMWDLNVGNNSGGMTLYAYDQTDRVSYGSPINIPTGKWFNIEVRYVQATSGGHITIWQDGQQIIDASGPTVQSGGQIDWAVESQSNGVSPSNAQLYVDDAAIGTGYMAPSSAPAPTATPVTVTPTPTVVTPTATPALPTPTPVVPTSTPVASATPVPTSMASTPVATSTPAATAVPPTATATPMPSPIPTYTPTPKPTLAPTATPKPTLAPTATPKPTSAPTATPQPSPTPSRSTWWRNRF